MGADGHSDLTTDRASVGRLVTGGCVLTGAAIGFGFALGLYRRFKVGAPNSDADGSGFVLLLVFCTGFGCVLGKAYGHAWIRRRVRRDPRDVVAGS